METEALNTPTPPNTPTKHVTFSPAVAIYPIPRQTATANATKLKLKMQADGAKIKSFITKTQKSLTEQHLRLRMLKDGNRVIDFVRKTRQGLHIGGFIFKLMVGMGKTKNILYSMPKAQNIKPVLTMLAKSAKPENREKIRELTRLWEARKIPNGKTVENLARKLADTRKHVLEAADKKYKATVAKYSSKLPITGRLKAKTSVVTLTDHITDLTRPKAHIEITIETNQHDEKGNEKIGFDALSHLMEKRIENHVRNTLQIKKTMKFRLRLLMEVVRETMDSEGKPVETKENVTFSLRPEAVTKANLEEAVGNQLIKMRMEVDRLNERLGGSNWKIKRYNKLCLDFDQTRPSRASSYLETPEKYKNPKCGLINIRNENDNECFKWCMLYHQSPKGKHDHELPRLRRVEDKYVWDGVEFPADYDHITHFEEQNKISIFVYTVTAEGEIVKDKDGNGKYLDNLVTLLRIESEDNAHYIYIKHLDRLLHNHYNCNCTHKKMCLFCEKLVDLDEHESHMRECYKFVQDTGALLELPQAGAVMEFQNHKNKLVRPFMIYADFESTLFKTDDPNKIAEHVPNSVGFAFVCTFDPSRNFYKQFTGEGCVMDFLIELNVLAEKCIKEMQENERMVMTEADERAFKRAKCCHICQKAFANDENKMKKVRDHDHRTGKFRGAAHNKCNINFFSNRYLPVVFHNLRNYDSHFIIHAAHEVSKVLGDPRFSCIPNNYEKFLSFTIGDLKFMDSFQFMASSLEKLAENLYDREDKYRHFHNMRREFPDHIDLLCKKGHYPYEWVDSHEKLQHIGLPPRENFYSELKKESITQEEYQHAQHVYGSMGCQTFGDYHSIYLKTDVLLLADVFEQFRKTCSEYYQLDPANYLTAPSLAWDAMLLLTGIQLELITDTTMLDMIERQKRGGLCFVGSKRYVKANNPYVEDFNINEPTNYLMYWDANNLYGWAMSQHLPYEGLRFVEDVSLDNILQTPDEADEGYIIECDLHFPPEIHDKLKEYPPCPENIEPQLEWFSEYQTEVATNCKAIKENGNYSATCKLIPHLFDRKKYVLHYRVLKFVLELGAQVTHINKVLTFKQKPWLKQYIDFNTQKRTQARNDFEKDFFKLMNNAVFGKTMENVKNRADIRLSPND